MAWYIEVVRGLDAVPPGPTLAQWAAARGVTSIALLAGSDQPSWLLRDLNVRTEAGLGALAALAVWSQGGPSLVVDAAHPALAPGGWLLDVACAPASWVGRLRDRVGRTRTGTWSRAAELLEAGFVGPQQFVPLDAPGTLVTVVRRPHHA